jgi:hypothetical protein
MPEHGPLELDDGIVWHKNGNIHREDGPAIEFMDGRKLWVLNDREVTEQEVAAHRQARERAARERSDTLWQSHADQIGQAFHKGLDHDITVGHARKPRKKPAEQA